MIETSTTLKPGFEQQLPRDVWVKFIVAYSQHYIYLGFED